MNIVFNILFKKEIKKKMGACLLSLFLFLSQTIHALNIESVEVPEQAVVGGRILKLEGAGIRKKFVVDVYIGAFYTEGDVKNAAQARSIPGAKRMWFYFLREIESATFRQTWNEGLHSNNPTQVIDQNKNNVNKFIDLIDNNITKGDIMTIDYIPGIGTQLSINGKVKGTISDEHFYNIVLNVWMGEHPPSLKFQKALLNIN